MGWVDGAAAPLPSLYYVLQIGTGKFLWVDHYTFRSGWRWNIIHKKLLQSKNSKFKTCSKQGTRKNYWYVKRLNKPKIVLAQTDVGNSIFFKKDFTFSPHNKYSDVSNKVRGRGTGEYTIDKKR